MPRYRSPRHCDRFDLVAGGFVAGARLAAFGRPPSWELLLRQRGCQTWRRRHGCASLRPSRAAPPLPALQAAALCPTCRHRLGAPVQIASVPRSPSASGPNGCCGSLLRPPKRAAFFEFFWNAGDRFEYVERLGFTTAAELAAFEPLTHLYRSRSWQWIRRLTVSPRCSNMRRTRGCGLADVRRYQWLVRRCPDRCGRAEAACRCPASMPSISWSSCSG